MRARKAVSLVGQGPGGVWPKLGEAWGLNAWKPTTAPCPATRWFQMHPNHGRTYDEDLWLLQCPMPIYTLGKSRLNPLSRAYPLRRIPAGPLASTFDYMLALAILEQFTHITVSGCALQQGSPRERLLEHVSFAYWVGLARGRGITVTVLGERALHFPYKYGYDYDAERTFGQRMAFWAALGNLSFRFDDGGAKGWAKGWKAAWGPKKVSVQI